MVMNSTNTNGTPCDIHSNICLDPLLVDPANSNFNLQPISPCIDAGDTTAPYDPDGTIRDIGALPLLSFPLSIDIELINPNASIPARGGSFGYNVEVSNPGAALLQADVWTEATISNGNTISPILLYRDIPFQPDTSISRTIYQYVPSYCPGGIIVYRTFVGEYPATVFDVDSVSLEKLLTEGLNAAPVNTWDYYTVDDGISVAEESLLSASPNPFNPATEITFTIPEAGEVTLAVYDVTGRTAAYLAEGYYVSGVHTISWNASEQTSGIYFLRLQYRNRNYISKLLLVK